MDMDGVLVREEAPIPGAPEFLARLTALERPFLVLTNNSIYTPRDLAARLRASGIEVPAGSLWTSALATAQFLDDQRPGGTAFVIGESGLTTALHDVGYTLSGVDRLNALYLAIDIVRRGGTISLSGVYGGMADPLPLLTMFDKQIQFRMGQANVKHWVDDIMPLLTDDDPLGVESFHTHAVPLEQAPEAYEMFQKKEDGMVKVVLKP